MNRGNFTLWNCFIISWKIKHKYLQIPSFDTYFEIFAKICLKDEYFHGNSLLISLDNCLEPGNNPKNMQSIFEKIIIIIYLKENVLLQGTFCRYPPPILFFLMYAVVLKQVSNTCFFFSADIRFEGVKSTPKYFTCNENKWSFFAEIVNFLECYHMENVSSHKVHNI